MSVAVLWAEEKQTGPGRVVVERKEAAGVGGSVLEGRPLGAEGATCCGGDSGRSWGPEGGVAVGENHRGGGGGWGGSSSPHVTWRPEGRRAAVRARGVSDGTRVHGVSSLGKVGGREGGGMAGRDAGSSRVSWASGC